MARLQDGTYDFIGKVITAFRAPGVRHDDIRAFQEIVEARKNGKISSEEATAQVASINLAFAALWKWINDNGAGLSVVLAVITLYVAIAAKDSSDAGAAQAHQDAQQIVQVQDKIHQALLERPSGGSSQATQSTSRSLNSALHRTQTPTQAELANRKERRAAAARARHYPRS